MIEKNALEKRKWNKHVYSIVENSIIKKAVPYIKNNIVIDIGGNSGYHTKFYAEIAKKVIVYEPVPQVFEILKNNLKSSRLENIEYNNIAVGNIMGNVNLFVDVNRLSMTSQIPLVDSEPITVPITTLDIEHPTENISYVKIDVEGFEWEVLQGAISLIDRCKPALLVETYLPWIEKRGQEPDKIFKFLKNKGYSCYSWNKYDLVEIKDSTQLIKELLENHHLHDGDLLYVCKNA